MGEDRVRRRIWAQSVAVSVDSLEARLDALEADRRIAPNPAADAVGEGVRALLAKARDAALGDNPRPRRFANWWRGILIESAFQNLHAAEADAVLLLGPAQLRAELPDAVARVESGLATDDPRRVQARALLAVPSQSDPYTVRKIIEIGYAASDQMHSRVRSFRNIVLIAALLIAVVVAATCAVVALHPTAVPLCFGPDEVSGIWTCPTSELPSPQGGPSGGDILAVALLGLLGAAVAAAVSIRSLHGTSTPYDVPLALTFLKLPTGSLTAVAALIAIRGEFIPGLSTLDSQEQILAYALVFGYAQQLLTGLVDKQAQSILSNVPSTDPQSPVKGGGVATVSAPPTAPAQTTQGPADGDAGPDVGGPGEEVPRGPDPDADFSDVPDPEARDVSEAGIEDDSGAVLDVGALERQEQTDAASIPPAAGPPADDTAAPAGPDDGDPPAGPDDGPSRALDQP